MSKLRARLTYANVMATIAVFIALAGASYAAIKLPKSSVGTRQLKKSAVTTAKIKNEAVTAAKVRKGTLTGKEINASTLGTVPTAQLANMLPPAENWQEVGFQNGWGNLPASEPYEPVAFYKDQTGVVHLKGLAIGGTPATPIFQLPSGYRPAAGKVLAFLTPCGGCTSSGGPVFIAGSGTGGVDGAVQPIAGGNTIGLDGITFRAES